MYEFLISEHEKDSSTHRSRDEKSSAPERTISQKGERRKKDQPDEETNLHGGQKTVVTRGASGGRELPGE
ncbi:hypothetical protein X777_10952 [Ooceraea biroi]|uniref:Uncharacterized protein n=1 Tax=Ooceraea biroi TaxID=2015173 RepID=A0A026W4U3_OOCBI|nr:hypothetical protein X777_10952 [Ooceraea biroi]